MATNESLVHAYAADPQWQTIPEQYQAISELADPEGKRMLTVGFTTYRDLIDHIGYDAAESCPELLRAALAILFEKAKDKAVVAAHLLGPADVVQTLCGDAEPEDETFYYAVLATLALKNAVSSYADYRKADYAAWKAEQAAKAAENANTPS